VVINEELRDLSMFCVFQPEKLLGLRLQGRERGGRGWSLAVEIPVLSPGRYF